MKNYSLSVFFTILLTVNLFNFSLSTITDTDTQQIIKEVSQTKNDPLSGYFFVQRFYPGNDPIDNVKESEFAMRQVYLEVNNKMIYFAASLEKIRDVEDSIEILQLFDPKVDNVSSAKCCSRISYHQYPQEKGLRSLLVAVAHNTPKGKPVVKRPAPCGGTSCVKTPINADSKPAKQMAKSSVPVIAQANFCLTLYVPDQARWRVCHANQDMIIKLHTKLLFNLLNTRLKGNTNMISTFLTNARLGREPQMKPWTWHNQDKWEGYCQTSFMQSPINIQTSESVKGDVRFSVAYNLLPVHTLIKRHEKEIIVGFTNFGGVVRMAIDNTYLLYTPTYMSFRFPSEHLINGTRFLGEILLHFEEFSKQKKASTTNGLILSIPVNPSANEHNFDPFEQLNVDFWKFEVRQNGIYLPKKFLKKKLLSFDLGELLGKVESLKPKYHLYFGSHTTPPCSEQTYHLVVDKPLIISGCQFKVLRNNSLLTSLAKELHARMQKPLNERNVYTFSDANVKYEAAVVQLAPQSFNKYLVKHGYGYKTASKKRRGKKVVKGQGRKKVLRPVDAVRAAVMGKKGAYKKLLQERRGEKADIVGCDLSKEIKQINNE